MNDFRKRPAQEGVSIIQLDDPHLCVFVNPHVRRQYDNPDRAADFAVEMDNQVLQGIQGVKLAVHLCRRAGHAPGVKPIIAVDTI